MRPKIIASPPRPAWRHRSARPECHGIVRQHHPARLPAAVRGPAPSACPEASARLRDRHQGRRPPRFRRIVETHREGFCPGGRDLDLHAGVHERIGLEAIGENPRDRPGGSPGSSNRRRRPGSAAPTPPSFHRRDSLAWGHAGAHHQPAGRSGGGEGGRGRRARRRDGGRGFVAGWRASLASSR